MKTYGHPSHTFVDQGWDLATILAIQEHCGRTQRAAQYMGWGFLVDDSVLIYKGTSAQDVRQALYRVPERRPTVAFCDGSGTKAKPCGIGVVIYVDGCEPKLIAENIGVGTNNVAELRAVWRALQAFPDIARRIMIYTDSEYTIGVLTNPTWHANANADLVYMIKEDLAIRGDNIKMKHVDGHSGIEGNEVADKLANIGRKIVTKVSP